MIRPHVEQTGPVLQLALTQRCCSCVQPVAVGRDLAWQVQQHYVAIGIDPLADAVFLCVECEPRCHQLAWTKH